ncbi:alpha/beta fold hydrolase [Pannonibacter sp. Pt2-lr]
MRKALEAGRADVTAEAVLLASALPSSPEWQTGPLSITRSKGGTGIPVVLIHGFASDGASWAPLEAYLKHRPLIRIELPSHGKSPRLRIPDFASLAAELRRALEQTGEEKVHLIGHSLGGALALALADTRPRQVESLTLIAPAGLGAEINGQVLSGICRAQRAESLAPRLRCLVANPDMITDGYAKAAMAGRRDAASGLRKWRWPMCCSPMARRALICARRWAVSMFRRGSSGAGRMRSSPGSMPCAPVARWPCTSSRVPGICRRWKSRIRLAKSCGSTYDGVMKIPHR